MAEIFFIADTHFSDERIFRYENRPFKDVEEMNAKMIENWNNKVNEDDILYLIGDVGDETKISQLNGRKYLIKGNHDIKDNEEYRKCGFIEVYDMPIILDDFWILSHKPLYVNENMPYANIFGHVHNSPMYRTFSKQHYCVTVERINYSPISFEDIKREIMKR